MIKNITCGAGITVTGGPVPPPYIDYTQPSAGLVRYYSNNLEVYTGSAWTQISAGYSQVQLDGNTLATLEWARRKMTQEHNISELAKQHPSVADAVAAAEQAQEQVAIVAALVQT